MKKEDIIKIDGYETKIEDRQPVWYAYSGKGKERVTYRMPTAFQEMYDDTHLAITKTTLGEIDAAMLDSTEGEQYIPLFTGEQSDGRSL